MYDLNSTNNSIFTSINYVYIKSEQWLLIFRFFRSLYQQQLFMMSPQSHKNIIWHPKFISNRIFMSTFVNKNAIWFTFFFEIFDKCLNSKKRAFFFELNLSRHPKTIASGLHVEESNVATVLAINWIRNKNFLNAELLFLYHSGCSVSNELILPGIFFQRFQSQTTHYKWLLFKDIFISIWMVEKKISMLFLFICIITIFCRHFICHVVQIWYFGWIFINHLVTVINAIIC